MEYVRRHSLQALRPVTIQANVSPYAEGSALCAFGNTQVLCTASVEAGVPKFLTGQEQGWVTAEYGMLPRATHTRNSRSSQQGGRAQEISRLIGRSLRAAVDMKKLAGYTIKIDCDVLVADGSTRCAGICGGYVALAKALATLSLTPQRAIAALSLGKVNNQLMADLCYAEDSNAQVDLNLVCAPGDQIIELQTTAEDGFISPSELDALIKLGLKLAPQIFSAQEAAINA